AQPLLSRFVLCFSYVQNLCPLSVHILYFRCRLSYEIPEHPLHLCVLSTTLQTILHAGFCILLNTKAMTTICEVSILFEAGAAFFRPILFPTVPIDLAKRQKLL